MRFILSSLVLSVVAAACDGGTTQTQIPLVTTPDPTAEYRVVVSLASLGSGIDDAAHDEILSYAGAYDIDVAPELYQWGREGEANLCFRLAGLNSEAQAQFVTDLQAIAQDATLVFVLENARCDTLGE